jgi:hypothetical protein
LKSLQCLLRWSFDWAAKAATYVTKWRRNFCMNATPFVAQLCMCEFWSQLALSNCDTALLFGGLSASIEVKRSVCWNLIFDGRQNNWESWKWNGTTRWQNLLWALVGALFSSCWAETGETFGRELKNELLTSLCTYILQHSFECSMFVCVCTGACAGCMWWTWARCWSVEKISWPLLWDLVCHNDLNSLTYL